MVNYGYESLGSERDRKLTAALCSELALPYGYSGDGKPYVEMDGLYSGVCIRKITDLTESQIRVLIKKADKVHAHISEK